MAVTVIEYIDTGYQSSNDTEHCVACLQQWRNEYPYIADVLQLEYNIDLTKEGYARGYQSHGSHRYR